MFSVFALANFQIWFTFAYTHHSRKYTCVFALLQYDFVCVINDLSLNDLRSKITVIAYAIMAVPGESISGAFHAAAHFISVF